ncbi:MAG: hypothetical protein M3322_07215 [Actinomycetota bacterium]|nr:hypothetical protein [Actinomycetota bacterium]
MSGGDYLAAAYVVVLAVVLVYVLLIALKLSRLDRDLESLARRAKLLDEERRSEGRESVSARRVLARGGEGRG